MELEKLQEVNLREIWKNEQTDFSAWLAKEENLSLLSETLGLSLIEPENEKFVGPYRYDILCKDEITGKNVVIENQLEQTNHEHLGKCITYSAGLDASIIIWIVSKADDEHSRAVEWFNQVSSDDVSFFLIEIHAYKIGESLPAPYFKVIEQPNGFSKQIKSISSKGDLNKSEQQRLDFWNKFNELIEKRGNPFNKRKATTDHWYDIAIGSSKCKLSYDLINREHKVRIGFWIPDDKNFYDEIYKLKDEIEDKLCNYSLVWDRLDDKKTSGVYYELKGLNFDNPSNYDYLMNKSIDIIIDFKDVFGWAIKEIL